MRALPAPPAPLQTKLQIGAIDDPLEREADRVADGVMNMPEQPVGGGQSLSASARALQRKCSCDGSCESCKSGAANDDHGEIQMKSPNAASRAARPVAPPIVHDVLHSPGRPLDSATRAFFEPRLGGDFGDVRVHADARAGESAERLQAEAYTVGRDLVFAPGQYAPHTSTGRRLLAHELSHVLQQSEAGESRRIVRRSAKVAGCGLLNLTGSILNIGEQAHRQIQAYLLTKGVEPEFEIPRATKMQLDPRCRANGTPWGAADLATRSAAGINLAEIKPVTMAGRARAKLEVGHYRRRATQSLQRLYGFGTCGRRPSGFDDAAFQLGNGLTPATGFSLLSGVLSGDETIGPYWGDPSLTLKAKEVGAGAVCYWCTKDTSQQSKQPKPPGPSAGIGVSVGSSAGGAYNAGVGVSIQSDSTAYGTAGAGVSYKSDSKAAGVAGAGASAESDTMAAGAAGAGAAKDTQSIGTGVAGAGAAQGSVGAAAGAAAAGTSEESATAGAGVASKGSVKNSAIAGAGGTGSGHVEGVTGAGTGSPKKPVEAKDIEGGGKSQTPPPHGSDSAPGSQQQGQPGTTPGQTQGGKEAEGGGGTAKSGTAAENAHPGGGQGTTPGGAGTAPGQQGAKKGTGTAPVPGGGAATGGSTGAKDTAESAAAKGAQGAKEAGPDPGSSGGTAASGGTSKDAAAPGATKTGGGLAVAPLAGPGATTTDREKAEAEAAKVSALLAKASPGQVALFRYLAQSSPTGQYVVPASQWVDMMMKATEGLSEEDIQYLQSLDWKPAHVTTEELRKKVLEALKNKKPAPTAGETPKAGEGGKKKKEGAGDASGGQGTAAKGSKAGDAGGGDKDKKKGPALGDLVTPSKYNGAVENLTPNLFIQPDNKQITPKTAKGAKVTLEVRWQESGVIRRAKVEYEVVADPTIDTDPKTKKQIWRFDLQSTNTDALRLSPQGVTPPSVLPPHTPATYWIPKK